MHNTTTRESLRQRAGVTRTRTSPQHKALRQYKHQPDQMMLKRSRDYGLYLTPWAMHECQKHLAPESTVSVSLATRSPIPRKMAVHLATTVVVLSLQESPLLEGAERKQDKSLRPTYFRSRETALSLIVDGVNVVYPSLGW